MQQESQLGKALQRSGENPLSAIVPAGGWHGLRDQPAICLFTFDANRPPAAGVSAQYVDAKLSGP